MGTRLRARVAGVLLMATAGMLVVGAPTPALAEPTCVDVPVNDANGNPLGYVCVDSWQDPNGEPAFRVNGGVPYTSFSATVEKQDRVGSWVHVCVTHDHQTRDATTFCVLPE